VLAAGIGQRAAALDAVEQVGQQLAHRLAVGQVDQEAQSLVDGQARVQHGGELAGDHRDLAPADPAMAEQRLAQPALQGRAHVGGPGHDRLGRERHMALVTQLLDHGTLVVAVDLALDQVARSVDRAVAKPGHHSASRVTRTTSSTDVIPAATLAMPSCIIGCMPEATATRCSSVDSACCRIWRRIGSVMIRISLMLIRPL
jgi:hypothetical protein